MKAKEYIFSVFEMRSRLYCIAYNFYGKILWSIRRVIYTIKLKVTGVEQFLGYVGEVQEKTIVIIINKLRHRGLVLK